jgi:hypothetical protein
MKSFPNPGAQNALQFRKKTFTKCFFAHGMSPGIQNRIWNPDKKIANAGSRSVYKEYCIETTCRYA